jgi:hypothetical protein
MGNVSLPGIIAVLIRLLREQSLGFEGSKQLGPGIFMSSFVTGRLGKNLLNGLYKLGLTVEMIVLSINIVNQGK